MVSKRHAVRERAEALKLSLKVQEWKFNEETEHLRQKLTSDAKVMFYESKTMTRQQQSYS